MELEKLSREASDAIECMDRVPTRVWAIVRTELARLADRNAALEAKATRDHDWITDLLAENKKAADDLAALRARIAGSSCVQLTKVALGNGYSLTVSAGMSVNDVDDLHSKRVRLLVED